MATNQTMVYDYDIIGRKTYNGRQEGSSSYTYYPSGNDGATNQLNTATTYGNKIEQYNYDAYGRVTSKVETVDGLAHTTTFKYNIYDDMTSQTYPSGFTCNYNYDANGYLSNIKNGTNTVTLYTQSTTNGLGNTTGYSMGNGKTSSVGFYCGTPTSYTTTDLQNLVMSWNYQTGNLFSRFDGIKNKTEYFTNDNLNRLLTSSGIGLTTLTSAYAANGNITTKTDAGNYTYGSSKIHAVTSVSNDLNTIPTSTQDAVYTSFYQPSYISEGVNRIDFTYASDDQRVKSVKQQNSVIVNTRYYFGDYEKDITSGTTRHIHYVLTPSGLGCIVERIGTTDTYHYTYTDHLGSIVTVTNCSGIVEYEQNFDGWGRNRNATTCAYTSIPTVPIWLYRGFTGHEHLPQFGLINMNGRLYDPIVGRMLSLDNNVQMPDNTHNYNRYSHALNNPLRYTDPDGEEIVTLASIGIVMLISAATYTAVHLVTHEGSFDGWNWGAFAGAVVAGGVGGFVSPTLTAAGVAGLANGAITGPASGFAGSLTGGLINKERGKELWTKVALGTGIGALLGGVVEGVKASADGRNFCDGSKVTNTTVIIDQPIPPITQKGDNNCLPTSGAAVDQSLGGLTQETARGWFPGTSAQDDPLHPKLFWEKFTEETGCQTQFGVGSPERAKSISLVTQKGYRVNLTMVEGNAKVGHSYVVSKITSTTRIRLNGTISSPKLTFSAMNPYNGSFESFNLRKLAAANSITFINPF